MRRLLLLSALCATAVLTLAPASQATSYVYGSCAEMPTQELAQGTLDDQYYSTLGPEDELNLDPDGDGVACNDPGNLVGGEGTEEPVEPTMEVTQPGSPSPTQYGNDPPGHRHIGGAVEEAAEAAEEGTPNASSSLTTTREKSFEAVRQQAVTDEQAVAADEQAVSEEQDMPSM